MPIAAEVLPAPPLSPIADAKRPTSLLTSAEVTPARLEFGALKTALVWPFVPAHGADVVPTIRREPLVRAVPALKLIICVLLKVLMSERSVVDALPVGHAVLQ